MSNLDLCRFYRFYTGKNIKGLMKCLGKGSPGSTRDLPNKISADAPLTPILHLGRLNASRVPTLGCGRENLVIFADSVRCITIFHQLLDTA